MIDQRIINLAQTLVNYCVRSGKKIMVGIIAQPLATPLVQEVVREVLRRRWISVLASLQCPSANSGL